MRVFSGDILKKYFGWCKHCVLGLLGPFAALHNGMIRSNGDHRMH